MKNYGKAALIEKWDKAYQLLAEQEQDSDNHAFNRKGEPYDHEKLTKLVKVLEVIETQLTLAGVTDKDWATRKAVETFTNKA